MTSNSHTGCECRHRPRAYHRASSAATARLACPPRASSCHPPCVPCHPRCVPCTDWPLSLLLASYVLLESPDAHPTAINLTQFRGFTEDCKIAAAKADVDIIFTRANRAIADGSDKKPKKDAGSDKGKMGQDEFVHAIIRLGVLRAEAAEGRGSCKSLAASFDSIMKECVSPHAVFDLEDDFSAVLQTRGVRAALAKHREALKAQYLRWSGAEVGLSSASSTMSLTELMLALKEAKLLCDKCTAREVTSFFVRVNADDELYLPDPKSKGKGYGATELDYVRMRSPCDLHAISQTNPPLAPASPQPRCFAEPRFAEPRRDLDVCATGGV